MNSNEAASLIGFMQLIQSKRQRLMASSNVRLWQIVLQKSFCLTDHNFFRAVGAAIEYILMWGTTSFCDELTGDFGGAFEAPSIDGCLLFCRFAEI